MTPIDAEHGRGPNLSIRTHWESSQEIIPKAPHLWVKSHKCPNWDKEQASLLKWKTLSLIFVFLLLETSQTEPLTNSSRAWEQTSLPHPISLSHWPMPPALECFDGSPSSSLPHMLRLLRQQAQFVLMCVLTPVHSHRQEYAESVLNTTCEIYWHNSQLKSGTSTEGKRWHL